MSLIVLALALAFIGAFAASWRLYNVDKDYGKIADSVQTVATVVALFLGGYWYFVDRKGQPHADVTLTATAAKLRTDRVLVLVKANIVNRGEQLLKISRVDTRAMALGMSDAHLDEIMRLPSGAFPAAFADGRALYSQGEIQWQTLRELRNTQAHEIEPGEQDSVYADLIVSCDRPRLKLSVSVHKNVREDQWWKRRVLMDLTPLCAGEAKSEALVHEVVSTDSGPKEDTK